ncbi:MAG: hypothetical protein KAY54_01660 [Burkholderiaceae bacterium]|nr:hypothetical protein [Vitreoscilla sp.]MBP8100563.1 hypothetical protein [Burkholderiaceae bacterium]
MSYYFPEGTKLYYSVTFAATKTITALSNASPAAATSTSHGYVDDDEILMVSGWEDATDTVYMVDQTDANTFSVLGLDASNTSFYPAGTGTGTASKVSSWVEVPQLLDLSTSGGDVRLTTISPLAKRNDIQVATGFNATALNFTLGHDPANATYIAMLGISRTLTKVALKVLISGSAPMYGYGYMSVSEMPRMARNQANQVAGTITMLGRPIAYGS